MRFVESEPRFVRGHGSVSTNTEQCHYCFVHKDRRALLTCCLLTTKFANIIIMAALWNRQAIIFLPCGFYLSSFSSPNLSGRRLDVYNTIPYIRTKATWCGLSANLECRSEMCCTRLAGNTGRKNDAKIAICAP